MSNDMGNDSLNKVRIFPIMVALFLGSFVAILASSTVNVALPILQEDFDTTLGTIQWTLTGFMLAMGSTAPISGYLGERFSYKYLYAFGLIGFTVSSGLCAVAWNAESLIGFRILQGAFAGLIMPATMAIIYQVIPREKQAMAMSLWGMSAMLAPAIGPTFSGWLLDNFAWEWLFLMNVPIGALAALSVFGFIPYYRLNVPKRFDLIGLVTVVVGTSALLLALGKGHDWGWGSAEIATLLGAGVVALLLFVWRELSTETPILNLRVLANGRFSLTLIITIILTVSMYSGVFLTPVFLQQIQGVSAMDTGLILLPSSVAMALCMPIVGKLYHVVGPKWLMLFGITLLIVGTIPLSWLSIDVSHTYILAWMTVRTVGMAFVMMPASNAGMERVPPAQAGHASSLNNWTRNVFGSFAIAIFTSLLASRGAVHGKDLMLAGDADMPHVQAMAFTLSVNDVYLIATIIAVAALPLALLVKKLKLERSQGQAENRQGVA